MHARMYTETDRMLLAHVIIPLNTEYMPDSALIVITWVSSDFICLIPVRILLESVHVQMAVLR